MFALEIAKSVVCTSPIDHLPCGTCSACIRAVTFDLPKSGKKPDYERISFSEHPDVGMIVPNKKTIYIDAVRHLVEEAQYRPFEGRGRVFIIDEAEKLGLTRKAAANALLKTLEEPAQTTHLILITSQPSSLLQTIHSRCQTFRFAAPEREELISLLKNEHDYPQKEAELAASVSRGSIGGAVELNLDEYRQTRDILVGAFSGVNGLGGLHKVLEASDALANPKAAFDFEQALGIGESIVRDALLLKTGSDEKVVNLDVADEIKSVFDSKSITDLCRMIEQMESMRGALRVNLNKRSGADALFVKMAGN